MSNMNVHAACSPVMGKKNKIKVVSDSPLPSSKINKLVVFV